MSGYERRFRHRQTGVEVTNILSTTSRERRISTDVFWFLNSTGTVATCIPGIMVQNSTDWTELQPIAWQRASNSTFLHQIDPFTSEPEVVPIWTVQDLIHLFEKEKSKFGYDAFSAGYNNEDIDTEADELYDRWVQNKNNPTLVFKPDMIDLNA